MPDYGDHCQIDGIADEDAYAVQIIGHAVGGDLYGSEAGNNTYHQHTAQLEDAVLHTAWYADVEDFLHHSEVRMEGFPEEADIKTGITQKKIEDDTAYGSGDQ